jgi:hypothetical protein
MKLRFLTAKGATAEIHRLRDEIRAIDPGYEIQPNRRDTMTGRDGKMFFFHIAGANNRITAMAHQLSELKAGRAKRTTATPAKVTSHFAHVTDLEARTMLERLHPNGLPKPAAISPTAKTTAPVAPQTWTEKCRAARK